ncbi:hypothetical protein [Spirillospora sp. NPDC047279]|uniref:hypothetical protein n=1 Tax=Spirillospora sp. NPDC047279 TaxID=3155478 RepID=UPI0033CAE2B9
MAAADPGPPHAGGASGAGVSGGVGGTAGRRGPAGCLVAVLLAGLLAGVLATGLVAVADASLRDTKVIGKVGQPASVRYPDGRTHHAGIVEVRTWLFHRHRPYELVLGSDPSLSYGHSVTFEATGEGPPKIVAVEWRAEGARVRLDSGHEVFVPAQKFLGGR